MTAEDTDNRDEDQREDEQRGDDQRDEGNSDEDNSDEDQRDEDQRGDDQRDEGDSDEGGRDEGNREDASDDEKVKQDDRYSDKTPGVVDARPGRDDIGESQMPSDYHEAVAQRPVEVKLPETPDLSEDAERNDD